MPAPKANQYAAKNKGLDSRLNVGCKEADKLKWKEAAKATGNNLTDWTSEKLNEASAHCKAVRKEFKLDKGNCDGK